MTINTNNKIALAIVIRQLADGFFAIALGWVASDVNTRLGNTAATVVLTAAAAISIYACVFWARQYELPPPKTLND